MSDMQEVGSTLNTLFDPTTSPLVGTLGAALAQAVETMEAAAVATDGSTSAEATAMHDRLHGVVRCLGEAASELVAAAQAKDALLASWGLEQHAPTPAPAINGVAVNIAATAAVNIRESQRAAPVEALLHRDGVALLKQHLVGVYAARADLNIDLVGIVEVRDIYMVGREGLVAAAVTDAEGAARVADELQRMFPDLPPLGASADGEVAALLYDSLQDVPAALVAGALYNKLAGRDTAMNMEEFATLLNKNYSRNNGQVSADLLAARDLANRFVARFSRAKQSLPAEG